MLGEIWDVEGGRLFLKRLRRATCSRGIWQMIKANADRVKTALLLIAVSGLVSGIALHFAGRANLANIAWFVAVIPVLAALLIEILRSLWQGEVGLDIVAALSMTAALVFGETLAAAVVAVMYSGGTFLESFAEGRAQREMHALLSRVPRGTAMVVSRRYRLMTLCQVTCC
jgi:cation transport ATPase